MKKYYAKRILPLAFTALLISCTNHPNTDPHTALQTPAPVPAVNTPVPTGTISNSFDDITIISADPSADDLTPSIGLDPSFMLFPEIVSPNPACMYLNSSNSFPLLITPESEIKFYEDDMVTISDAAGSGTFRLSSEIHLDGQDLSDSDAWFFCGAFQSDDMIFAHYDYLGSSFDVPSLLIKIDPAAKLFSCCICSQNPRKHFSDAFTILEHSIYYTYTVYEKDGTAATSILRSDLNGQNTTVCVTGTAEEIIPYLASDGNFLYFIVSDTEDSSNRLVMYDPASNSYTTIVEKVVNIDFLSVLNGFILTSTQNNTLTYYNQDGFRFTLRLSDNASDAAGCLMTDGELIYIPLISYDNDASTQVVVIDLAARQVFRQLTLSDSYFHCVGMINQFIYAENIDDYIIFDVFKINE